MLRRRAPRLEAVSSRPRHRRPSGRRKVVVRQFCFLFLFLFLLALPLYLKRPRLLFLSDPIPRNIWITSPAHNLSMALNLTQSWSRLNPEYRVIHHNDQEAREFICTHFDQELCKIYDSYPVPVMKADVWRYAVLYTYGGVYSDVNAECRVPIRKWNLEPCGFWAGQESNRLLCQWTLAARPGHPALKQVLDLVRSRAKKCLKKQSLSMRDCLERNSVHFLTGPGVFTDGVEQSITVPFTGITLFDQWTRTWIIRLGSWFSRDVCIRPQGHIRYNPKEGYHNGFVYNDLELGGYSKTGWVKQVSRIKKENRNQTKRQTPLRRSAPKD